MRGIGFATSIFGKIVMTDTATALNDYLSSRFGITLERALADAAAGVVSLALHGAVDIVCDPGGRYAYDDDGVSEQFAGTIVCEGVIYRFACATFTDASGARYVEAIGELEAVGWGVRLAVPAQR
jgi:hypothetical protein